MTISKKETYLERVRNLMLFRHSHKDIFTTLEDLNLYFASGLEDGKTEEELCGNLGDPEQFVRELSQGEEPVRSLPPMYLAGFCILCALGIWDILRPNLPLSCILTAAAPVFLWRFLGGRSLLQLGSDKIKNHKAELLYFLFALAAVIAQQIFIVYINQLTLPITDGTKQAVVLVHRLSLAAIWLSALVLPAFAYRLYKGKYLSLGSIFSAMGALCSSLLCRYLLLHMEAPGIFSLSMACSLPFALGVAIGAASCLALLKMHRNLRRDSRG